MAPIVASTLVELGLYRRTSLIYTFVKSHGTDSWLVGYTKCGFLFTATSSSPFRIILLHILHVKTILFEPYSLVRFASWFMRCIYGPAISGQLFFFEPYTATS